MPETEAGSFFPPACATWETVIPLQDHSGPCSLPPSVPQGPGLKLGSPALTPSSGDWLSLRALVLPGEVGSAAIQIPSFLQASPDLAWTPHLMASAPGQGLSWNILGGPWLV